MIQTIKKGLNIFHLENEKELKDCPIEDVEQMQFTADLKYNYPELLYFHPVNEGAIPVHYRVKQTRKGLLKGASDIIILSPSNHYNYLVIELKRQNVRKSTPPSKEQAAFLNNAKENGGFACVAYGAKAAMFVVEQYAGNNLSYTDE